MTKKNYMIPVVLTAVALICCMVGCDDDNPVRPYDTSYFFPLTVGNYWIHRTDVYVADTLYSTSDPDTSGIDTSITWHGRSWFGEAGANHYLLNDVGGVWNLRFDDEDYPEGDSCLMIMYPSGVGDSWVHEFENDTYEVLAVSETVTTPAGRFDGCYKYRVTSAYDPDEPYTIWYKPGVGLIQVLIEIDYYGTLMAGYNWLIDYHVE